MRRSTRRERGPLHTVASFLFGLAFAPELARILARTRMRMEATWSPAPAEEAP